MTEIDLEQYLDFLEEQNIDTTRAREFLDVLTSTVLKKPPEYQ